MVRDAMFMGGMLLLWLVTLVGAHMLGVKQGIAIPRAAPQLSTEDIDTQCVVWLFKNDLKEAKARICKGRK